MSEQITAEIVTEEPQTDTPGTEIDPYGDETPTQIEEEPTPPTEQPASDTPEVSATVTQGASGVWAVNIFTQHPDTLDVAVNGKAVWRGIP